MSPAAPRTKYTPLWETWCTKCEKGVSPDHAGRCAWCTGKLRRNHQANQHHPGRYPGIPSELFDAARRAHRSGIPINEFARAALHLTKRRNVDGLAQSIRHEFRRRGWEVGSDTTMSRIAKHRYKQRLALGERTPDLCAGKNRHGEPCKRHATPGNTHCNLHDTNRDLYEPHAQRLRDLAERMRSTRARTSELAPLLREWANAYGYGARTAALHRAGITSNVYQRLLLDHQRGIDRSVVDESAERIRALIATPPQPCPGDGVPRRGAA